jgi:ribosomal protein L3 glutamine methyltransferase
MAALPPEFLAEPELALSGNAQGGTDGMDFVRQLLTDTPAYLSEQGVLVLEIGHEREHFEAAFPRLEVVWLDTSAGSDQVLLITRDTLAVWLEDWLALRQAHNTDDMAAAATAATTGSAKGRA